MISTHNATVEHNAEDESNGILRTLVAQFMQNSAQGDLVAASKTLGRLFQYRGRFNSFSTLREIASGKIKIIRSGSIYRPSDFYISPTLQRDFDDAFKEISQFLELSPPTVFVENLQHIEGVHLTIENFPGFAVIKLSSSSKYYPDVLRATVFHEAAHASLTCGVKLLDEGFASLMSDRFVGENMLAKNEFPGLNLRTMLSNAASNGLFFEGIGANAQSAEAIRKIGGCIISRVYEIGGALAVKEMFLELAKTTNDKEVAFIVEKWIGKSLEEFYTPSARIRTKTDLEIVNNAKQAVFISYKTQSFLEIDSTISLLDKEWSTQEPETLDALICAKIARAILQINLGESVSLEDVAKIDVLILEGKILSEGRLWAIRGHRAVLALKLEKNNIVKISVYSKKAVTAYEHALRLTPNDIDLQIGRSLLYINTPKQYGGNRDLGLSNIRKITNHCFYGDHAKDILRNFGEFVPEPPISEFIENTKNALEINREPSKLAMVPMLIAKNLRLNLSNNFALDVDDLKLHPNERIAIIGQNGSGKTMLLESLVGLRKLDAGSIEFNFPNRPKKHSSKEKALIGASLQNVGLFGAIYVREIVRLHRSMYSSETKETAKILGIDELMDMQYKTLSRGQSQRVQLFLALAHHPAIAFLDEPSLGLDEWFSQAMRNMWGERELSMMIVSHIPADIERMDRIICMADGRIIDQGTLPELVQKYAGKYKIRISEELTEYQLSLLFKLPGQNEAPEKNDKYWHLSGKDSLVVSFQEFARAQGIVTFSVEETDTEDLLSKITRD